ncbi:DUF3857 domain-containing protein [Pedobacter sp. ASV12]|uniref:DUF3857 domain-containing protein n=1 Tax=Pedobacter sp. ASV12 TaxID=2795120 RepID=UPI0018EB22D6|nr:DUF3857 domain-containing protein [Pedobacter sp. ASV12]
MLNITPRKVLLAALLIFVNLTSFAQRQGFSVDKKEPEWLEKITVSDQKLASRDIQGGYYLSLYELQQNIETKQQYTHLMREIAADNGAQNGSEISVTYDPSYQQLTFHKVIVWRNNQPIDKLKASAFKIIQNEKELSRFIYSGTFNAYLILDDVRKGDRIEYAYTLKGENPVFGNNYYNHFYFEGGSKIVNIYTNLIAHKNRALQFRNYNKVPALKTKTKGDLKVYEWQGQLTNTFQTQDFEPTWYDPLGRVQVSEYKSWKDIVDWALQINAYDLSAAPAFNSKVKELKEAAKGNATTYLELATRFVQDQVRYMGIEMGEYSHRPNSPEKVLKQRYGDCKDKSILLINLLKSNGITAYPVYLSTYLKEKTTNLLPTPGAFNHAIVVVEFEGRKIWIDPTISEQRGPIKDIYFPYTANVLVVKPGNDRLELVKSNPKGKINSQSTIKLSDTLGGSKSEFEIRTTYTANCADDIRSEISSSGADELEKNFAAYYAKFYPGIVSVKNMEIIDDEKNNVVKLVEKYEIENFWQKDPETPTKFNANFYGDLISGELRKLNRTRNFPMALKYPLNVHQTLKVILPDKWKLDDEKGDISQPYYSFKYDIRHEGDTLTFDYDYSNLAEEIPATAIQQYIKDRTSIINNSSYSLYWSGGATSADNADVNGLMVAIGLFTLILATLLGLFLYYRKGTYQLEEIKNALPIGGWLVLLAIGMVSGPIGLLFAIFSSGTFDQSTWDIAKSLNGSGALLYKATNIFECIMNVFAFVFSIFMLIMFFKRMKSFPSYFIIYRTVYLAVIFIDVILIAMLNAKTTLDYDVFKNIRTLVFQLIISTLWIAYFIKSSRVKQTFVFTYPASEWRNALIMDLSRNINVPMANPEGQSIPKANEQTQQENNERL